MAPNIVKLVKRQAERVPEEAQPTIAAPKIFGHHTPHAKWPVTEAPSEGKTNGNGTSWQMQPIFIYGDELCFQLCIHSIYFFSNFVLNPFFIQLNLKKYFVHNFVCFINFILVPIYIYCMSPTNKQILQRNQSSVNKWYMCPRLNYVVCCNILLA